MDVKFITTLKDNLNAVPVVNGQIIALEDVTGFYYDMKSTRHLVSCIHVETSLTGVGQEGHLYVIKDGDDAGIYIWDSDVTAYRNISNEFADKLLTIVQDRTSTKLYPVSTNGESDSTELYYNTNVYYDLKNGTITATEFRGKSTSAYSADEAAHAENADEAEHAEEADLATLATTAKLAEVANKIGESTVGSMISAVYILEGVPTAVKYTVEKSVPANAVFTDTTYTEYIGATSTSDGEAGLVKQPLIADAESFLKGDGTWASVIQSEMVGCTSSEDGETGLVPAPIAGEMNSFLKGDGTWSKYSAGSGLVLSSLTFSLAESGVIAGTYGPDTESTSYSGEHVTVPQITVDRYGRITDVVDVSCLQTFSENTVTFSIDDDGYLWATFND